MKVNELIEKLKLMPQEAKVALYCDLSEDSSMANSVKLLNKQTGPYNKSDDVWFIYDLDEKEELVFIK